MVIMDHHNQPFFWHQTDLTITGELDLSLQFQPPHYLFITVHRACGLSPRAGHQSADPMIKSAIPGLGAYFSSQVHLVMLNDTFTIIF